MDEIILVELNNNEEIYTSNFLTNLFLKSLENKEKIIKEIYKYDFYEKLVLKDDFYKKFNEGLYPYYIFSNKIILNKNNQLNNIVNTYERCINLSITLSSLAKI